MTLVLKSNWRILDSPVIPLKLVDHVDSSLGYRTSCTLFHIGGILDPFFNCFSYLCCRCHSMASTTTQKLFSESQQQMVATFDRWSSKRFQSLEKEEISSNGTEPVNFWSFTFIRLGLKFKYLCSHLMLQVPLWSTLSRRPLKGLDEARRRTS